MIPRWLLPVLVVAFVLTTGWASYNLASQLSASSNPPSAPPVLTYQGTGAYFYVATLTPNDLYNSTTVSGSNLTLFAPITRWINLTFVDGVTLSTPADVQLADHFTVTLSTPAWSKSIDQELQHNATLDSTGLTIVDRYGVNVSLIENLTQTIDDQLGYAPSQFTVSFAPVVSGEISLGNETTPVSIAPFLNLTFTAALITPHGRSVAFNGGIPSGTGPTDPGANSAVAYGYLILAGSLAALAVSVGLLLLRQRRAKTWTLPALQTLIEPYEEIIVQTTKTPEATATFPVARWEDLVKVADTLGRPILQPLDESGERSGSTFYVVDGSVAYEYGYPSPQAQTKRATDPMAEPTTPEGEPEEPISDSNLTGGRLVDAPNVSSFDPTMVPQVQIGLVTEQLRADLDRIQRASLSPSDRAKVFELIRTTARQVRGAKPSETQALLEEFHRSLENYLGGEPSS